MLFLDMLFLGVGTGGMAGKLRNPFYRDVGWRAPENHPRKYGLGGVDLGVLGGVPKPHGKRGGSDPS